MHSPLRGEVIKYSWLHLSNLIGMSLPTPSLKATVVTGSPRQVKKKYGYSKFRLLKWTKRFLVSLEFFCSCYIPNCQRLAVKDFVAAAVGNKGGAVKMFGEKLDLSQKSTPESEERTHKE